jgi:glutaminase
MLHILTNAEYADKLYNYGFCDGNATAAVKEYHQQFSVHRIPDCSVFSKVFNTLCEHGVLPNAHVSSERACQQHVEEQENIL